MCAPAVWLAVHSARQVNGAAHRPHLPYLGLHPTSCPYSLWPPGGSIPKPKWLFYADQVESASPGKPFMGLLGKGEDGPHFSGSECPEMAQRWISSKSHQRTPTLSVEIKQEARGHTERSSGLLHGRCRDRQAQKGEPPAQGQTVHSTVRARGQACSLICKMEQA